MTPKETADGGPLTEFLQLQALMMTVKALIETHPHPEKLANAMNDLFAQFQMDKVFLSLPAQQRLWMRRVFSSLLEALPKPTESSGAGSV